MRRLVLYRVRREEVPASSERDAALPVSAAARLGRCRKEAALVVLQVVGYSTVEVVSCTAYMRCASLYCGGQASPLHLPELEIRKAWQSGRYAESGMQ